MYALSFIFSADSLRLHSFGVHVVLEPRGMAMFDALYV